MTDEWFKSSFSTQRVSCVEVRRLPGGGMAVRDSKDPDSPVLHFNAGEWGAFISGAKACEFDNA